MDYTAIVLAGGSGSRMRGMRMEKPLVCVHEKTLVLHTIERLQDVGIKKILVLTDNRTKEVSRTIDALSNEGMRVECIQQEEKESLGSALTRIMTDQPGGYVLISSDVVYETNPYALFKNAKGVSFLVDFNNEFNKFSDTDVGLTVSAFGNVHDVGHILPSHNALFAGGAAISRESIAPVLDALRQSDANASYEALLSDIQKKCDTRAVTLPHMLWYDINTPASLMRAEILERRKHTGGRPTAVPIKNLKVAETTTAFTYTKSQTTEVLIEGGLINHITEYKIMDDERTASQHILITDESVDLLYGDMVLQQFLSAGYRMIKLVAPRGEAAKKMDVYHHFAKNILGLGIDDQSIIFSLGGGATANLSGFLAATLYRGIGLIHIPTTFMCMNDVAVSLKQGLNDEKGKNLIGSYYQPLLVLIDPEIEMPDVLIRHGMSESIKHALGQDKVFFDYLLNYQGDIQDKAFRRHVIERTLALKIELMQVDLFENGPAILLQYGHEIGHSLERLTDFGLTHGESISIGMRVSAELAHIMNVTSKETIESTKAILKKYQLPYSIPKEIEKDAIIQSLFLNKKTRGKDVRFALLEHVGKTWKIRGEYGIPCPLQLIDEAVARSYA